MDFSTKVLDSAAELLLGLWAEPLADDEKTGQVFRIGDLAREFGVSLRALRFYEDRGLLQPRRAGNTRLYSIRDQARLRLVLFGKRAGFTLTEIKRIIELRESGASKSDPVQSVLEKSWKKLTALEAKRLELDQTISELRIFVGHLSGV